MAIGSLSVTAATATKTSLKNGEFPLPQTLSRLFHPAFFVKCWHFFWSWILKECIKVEEKKKEVLSCVPVLDKREIRHFHVLAVKRRVRNVQKSVMQSCCFNKRNLLLFWRSRCPHRLRCLSSLILTRAHRTLQNLLSLALISSIWTSHSQVTHIDTNPRPGLASILRMLTATAPGHPFGPY